jgi:hypothetical protein
MPRDVHLGNPGSNQPGRTIAGQAAGRFACEFFELFSAHRQFPVSNLFHPSRWVALGPFARFVGVI